MQQDAIHNTKTMTMEEQNAILREQISAMVDRLAETEKRLDLERVTRAEILEKEREDLLNQEREKIRVALMSEFEGMKKEIGEKAKELEKWEKMLDERESKFGKEMELMAVRLRAQVEREYAEKKEKVLRSGLFQVKEVQEMTIGVLSAAIKGDTAESEACINRLKAKLPEAVQVMETEMKEALDKAEKKGVKQAQHVAELVRMIFTRKSERVEFDDGKREMLIESMMKSLGLSDKEKEYYRQINRQLKEYRERIRMASLLGGVEPKGHGRKPIPDSMPRLAPITLYPDGYEGHEDEYRVIGRDVQEFILPVSVRYVVQPIERPVVVRKGDVLAKPQQSPCYEGPIWKSKASAELLAQIECGKYLYHMPFYRQAKKMKAEGFEVSDSTIDGWHQAVCGMLEPLYELQRKRVMESRLLAADGSPMPVIDNEKRRTVKQYIIQYRSIDTGVPIFLTTPGSGSGRGKAVIEGNLNEWTGKALMCDAYSGYDFVGKSGRVLCRCTAHMRSYQNKLVITSIAA